LTVEIVPAPAFGSLLTRAEVAVTIIREGETAAAFGGVVFAVNLEFKDGFSIVGNRFADAFVFVAAEDFAAGFAAAVLSAGFTKSVFSFELAAVFFAADLFFSVADFIAVFDLSALFIFAAGFFDAAETVVVLVEDFAGDF